MYTKKQVAKLAYVWGYIRAGTTSKSGPEFGFNGMRTNAPKVFEQDDTVLRCFSVNIRHDWKNSGTPLFDTLSFHCTFRNTPRTGWQDYGKGQEAFFHYDEIDFVKFKPVPKSFRSIATKDSVWEFTEDWIIQGYDGTDSKTVLPAGTEIKLSSSKMRQHRTCGSMYESCIAICDCPALLNLFTTYDLSQFNNALPVREVWNKLELVSNGQQKVYWHIENTDGAKIVPKRYATVGNVKAALRVRGGLLTYEYDNNNDDTYVPEWVISDNEWGTDTFPIDNGVWAVQYDHATDVELHREDMLEYMTMAKLKS
jgi:hypothetical protein